MSIERLPVKVYSDDLGASRAVARRIAEWIRKRNAEGHAAVLGLATGNTPVNVYRELFLLGDHAHDLTSTAHVIRKLLALGVPDLTLSRFYGLGKARKTSGIDLVGFGQFPCCLGEVPGLARIYRHNRQACLGKIGNQGPFQTSACLKNNQLRRSGFELLDQGRHCFFGMLNRNKPVAFGKGNVKAPL